MNRMILAGAAAAVALLAALNAPCSAPPTDELRRSAIVKAVETAGPAVVNIGTERMIVVRPDPFWELFGDLLPPEERVPPKRYKAYIPLGSGVIIDPDGYIVTNEHVLRPASSILVSLADGEHTYQARAIASHPEHDIAVIKINPEQLLPHAAFANSDQLMIGETAIAIGNPYGLENTVTTGVVSATRRSIYFRGKEAFKDFIQTDAAINFGNSGGALVDIHGRLIGINSAMRYGAENIGFAIPVNKVKQSLEMLLDPRQLKQMWVGVVLSQDEAGRCVVETVEENSPAKKAGLRPGDVILEIDGQSILGAYDYDLTILKHSPGDTVTFTIERDGARKRLALTLAETPKPEGDVLAKKLFGLEVRDLTKEDAAALELKLDGGVLVTGVEARSPAALKRLGQGDVIVRVERYSVPNVEQLGMLLERVEAGAEVLLWVVRDEYLIGNYLRAR